jgi:hypothetical protein
VQKRNRALKFTIFHTFCRRIGWHGFCLKFASGEAARQKNVANFHPVKAPTSGSEFIHHGREDVLKMQ